MAVSPIPAGFHTVTPYLVAKDADALLDFITRAFGARNVEAMRGPDGRIRHADVIVGDSHIMIGQASGTSPAAPAMLYLYVPDADAVYRQAIAAGAVSIQAPITQFYGDRHGAVRDCCENQWWIATHVEDVAPDELARRMANAAPKDGQ